MSRKQIAKNAKIKNSKFESKEIKIESGAQIVNVHIKAKKITIKSGATLTNCKLFSEDVVVIGKDSKVNENTIINAFKGISIGNRTIIDRNVVLGGMQSEQSQIEIGDDCVILYNSYLNNTRKISIGNNVGIGGYCLIFTHSSWQNVLDGYPYKFAEVTIKDNAWLPWNVTVFPGVTIGKDVTVGSGSVVTKDLPAGVFAAGIPAKIIRKKRLPKLSKAKKNAVAQAIIQDFANYAKEFLKMQNSMQKDSQCSIIQFKNKRLIFTSDFSTLKKNDFVVSLKIPSKLKKIYEWAELDSQNSKVSSNIGKQFIAFVRRYGIKIK